jgi:hypothetical protein
MEVHPHAGFTGRRRHLRRQARSRLGAGTPSSDLGQRVGERPQSPPVRRGAGLLGPGPNHLGQRVGTGRGRSTMPEVGASSGTPRLPCCSLPPPLRALSAVQTMAAVLFESVLPAHRPIAQRRPHYQATDHTENQNDAQFRHDAHCLSASAGHQASVKGFRAMRIGASPAHQASRATASACRYSRAHSAPACSEGSPASPAATCSAATSYSSSARCASPMLSW